MFWPDGTQVLGWPENTDSYKATAAKHGYGTDTTALCIEHEVLHVVLAHWLRIESHAMQAARGMLAHRGLCELEEAAVLAIQAYIRAIGAPLLTFVSEKSS